MHEASFGCCACKGSVPLVGVRWHLKRCGTGVVMCQQGQRANPQQPHGTAALMRCVLEVERQRSWVEQGTPLGC